MEPTAALRLIETVLRLAIRDVLGDSSWIEADGAPDKERLEERQREEIARRDGTRVSGDLLSYTETYQLTGLIEKNWEKFKPVFRDKGRTMAFFGVIEDVRNSVAHSRDLVPFERDLISGIAGQFRNLVSLYRSGPDQPAQYYPRIETIVDHFGIEGGEYLSTQGPAQGPRLDVGTVLTFTGSAFDAKDRQISWHLSRERSIFSYYGLKDAVQVAQGSEVSFTYTVTEEDVGEFFGLIILIRSASKYHRWQDENNDDKRGWFYPVNPPDED